MKKYYISLAVLGILFGYYAKVNYVLEDEKDVFFPITRAQLKVSKIAASAPGNGSTAAHPAQVAELADLSHLSQSELFGELHNKKVLLQLNNQQSYFNMIQTRLIQPYPVAGASKHSGNTEREIASRLGLLRAMSMYWPTPKQLPNVNRTVIKNFFAQVAKNKKENLMIRRQAYKNWLTFGDSVSQTNKNRMAENADNRLLHLVSLSDENLIESLTESAE